MSEIKQAKLHSLQVGLPRDIEPAGERDLSDKPWTTAFFKQPISHSTIARTNGLDGDGQADLEVHGGPDKAICVYSFDHYAYWQTVIGVNPLPTGAFGENFTLSGIDENNVCIGDVWQVGDSLVVQISQPRQPCWKLARRWQRKTLAHEVQDNGKTGWYFRVLKEGPVKAGMKLTLVERTHPDWTVAQANQVMHHDKHNATAAAELAGLDELSESWKWQLSKRFEDVNRS
jgi:MOSC domain-containing protein YiiM